jgi:LPS export ABC transporter permease LptG/LPS export ABC transporter permease LptF
MLLSRNIFREMLGGTVLGALLFTFVLFLQSLGRLFELIVRSSASAETVARLFLLVLPPALPFTVPIGTLAGILVGLGRMSADGEITAMRAAGIPSARVVRPVAVLAVLAMAVTAAASLWLTPWSVRESYRIINRLMAEQLTAEIQPRVFQEQFPNTILFVGDVVAGPVVLWKKVFVADLTPPAERKSGSREAGEGPRITVARQATAIPDAANNRIQLRMIDGSSYESGKSAEEYYISAFPAGDQVLAAQPPGERRARPFRETDTGPLFRLAKDSLDARIELHQRLALPPACLLLAMIGIPLGVSARKAGKSAALVLTVSVAFLYYMGLISLIGLARQGTLPVVAAVWTPNVVLAVAGLFLLARLERPGDRDLVAAVRGLAGSLYSGIRGRWRSARAGRSAAEPIGRLPLLPQVIDTYVLSSFLLYFSLFLLSFVLMTQVFTFFELLSDILKNHISMWRVFEYHVFLTPKLLYDSTPVSAMVAVLVTFGILAKHNEVTAMRACGVSVHRLALPVVFTSTLLSALLFAFDYYYVPAANRRQDAIRAEIKGRPVQTYLSPGRPWIFGRGSRIYYYKYFDADRSVMAGPSVFAFDPESFALRRHISAEAARWSASLRAWVFENGWARSIRGIRDEEYETFQATTFPDLDEPPSYFLKEVKQEKQMNFRELADYVAELRQSGFDTVRLQVQFHRKFSVPLFTLILAMISIPFSFLAGNRGALAGVGISLGIAIAYWATSQLFEQVGNISQLPAPVAAWAPNVLFFLASGYLMARVRT